MEIPDTKTQTTGSHLYAFIYFRFCWQLHKNAASNIEQVLAATPHEAPTIRPPASHHENYLS